MNELKIEKKVNEQFSKFFCGKLEKGTWLKGKWIKGNWGFTPGEE